MNSALSPKRHELCALLQTAFPVENRPFRILADLLHSRESVILDMTRLLVRERVIREIGPIFEARQLGYTSTLAAVAVEEERIAGLAEAMRSIREITHSYTRDNEFNLWFTITAINRARLEHILRWAEGCEGVRTVLELPMEQVFKISAVFGAEAPPPIAARGDIPASLPDEARKAVIRALQNGLPVQEQPFLALSVDLGLTESYLLQLIRGWMDNGVIRRFGARLDHNRAGYAVNTLVAWDGDHVQSWGKQFAEFPRVSHCYLRRSCPEWPYRLYTMVHARTAEEMDATLNAMRSIADGARVAVLPTRVELKKTSMKYFMEE